MPVRQPLAGCIGSRRSTTGGFGSYPLKFVEAGEPGATENLAPWEHNDDDGRCLDEPTILRFRHRLEKHKPTEKILYTGNELLTQRGPLLKTGAVVDASWITAPTSTKNKGKTTDPDMRSSKMGDQWCFGIKANLGPDADADAGLVHTVCGTVGHVSGIS